MKYINYRKGQGITEFALVLAFATFIGLLARGGGLLEAATAVLEPAAKILAGVDHHRSYDVTYAIQDIKSFQEGGHYGTANNNTGNTANGIHYKRGMIRSGWVDKNETDSQRQEIKKLYDELGASQWSFLNGLGQNYRNTTLNDTTQSAGMYIGDVGLYWTVEDLSNYPITASGTQEAKNYSKQLILQYFYSDKTNKYYVIKNYVWVNQKDVANHIALGGLHQQYYKPAGYLVEGCTEGFDTFAEAKELFERVRRNNGYSVVFTEDAPNTNNDAFAGEYQLVDNKYVKKNKNN